jgi:hypothetical protein
MSTESPLPPLEPEAMTSRLRIYENPPAMRLLAFVLPLAALASVAVILGLILTGYLHVAPGADTPVGKKLALQKKASKNADFGQEADSALHRVSWKESQHMLRIAADCCQELKDSVPKLNAQLTQLGTDEQGRRIASRTEWIDLFTEIRDRPRMAETKIAIQHESVNLLIEECEQALDDSDIVIPCTQAFTEKSATLHDQLSQAQKEVLEDQRQLATLLSVSAVASPTSDTLSEASVKRAKYLEQEELKAKAKAQTAQREAAERKRQQAALEAERKIQAAKAEQERIDQEARIAAEEAEKKKKEQEAKLAAQRAAAEQAHREKVAAFEREFPAMKSLLMPFISHGNLQLRSGSWMGGEEGPVSLEAIHQSGALNTRGTSHMLMYFGNGVNGRPMGSFPRGHAYDNGQVYKVQTFLLKYGDIMVERELLLP